MKYSLSAAEIGAIFALYEQPIPPNVADVLTGWFGQAKVPKWPSVSGSLVAKGLITEEAGTPALAPAFAEALGICFSADVAVGSDRAGELGPVVYVYDGNIVSIAAVDDAFEIVRAEDDAWGRSLVASIIGGAGQEVVATPYEVEMSVPEFDRILSLLGSAASEFDEACEDAGWDAEKLRVILDQVSNHADLRFMTQKPGEEFEMDSRLSRQAGTVWIAQVALGDSAGSVVLATAGPDAVFRMLVDVDRLVLTPLDPASASFTEE